MNFRQLAIVVVVILVGAALVLAPRKGNVEQAESTEVQTDTDEFEHQLESVKKTLDASVLASIEFFEGRLKQSTDASKGEWLDSLTVTWDRMMRPGIAAEYVLRKAEISNTSEAWLAAGSRFLGISRYFQAEDKVALNEKAIVCLEKAKELDPANITIKTQLGAAYVDGGQDPMKGIFLLREVVAEDSTNVEAQLNLGFFSMQSGQYDKAVNRFKTVLRIQPELSEVQLYLSEAYQANGDNQAALQELKSIVKNSSETLLTAEAERRIGQIKQN